MIQSEGSFNELSSKLAISYHSSDGSSLPGNTNSQTVVVSIVNPQGTVTTVTNNPIQIDDPFSRDNYIHENCDETMFRPVVTVITTQRQDEAINDEDRSQPVEMPSQLIVPVIDEQMLEQMKREREIEETRKQQEKERIRIAEQQEDRARYAKEQEEGVRVKQQEDEVSRRKQQEDEDGKKSEQMKAKKEKPDENPPPYQKRGKKAQKYNKKSSEPEKKQTNERRELPTARSDEKSSEKACKATSVAVDDFQTKPDNELSKQIENIELEQDVVELDDRNVEAEASEPLGAPEEIQVELEETEAPSIESKREMEETKTVPSKEMSPAPTSKFEWMLKSSMVPPATVPIIVPSTPVPTPETREIKPEKFEAPKPEASSKPEPAWKKKKGKKGKSQTSPNVAEDFPPLGSPPPLIPMPIEDHRIVDSDAILKISMHETIGDDEIEIIPLENTVVIQESPEKPDSDVEIIDEHFEKPSKQQFIKNEDFYDIDDDLPPLEPLESFDANFEPLSYDESPMEKEEPEETEEMPTEVEDEKEKMKTKMSELLKDTNMVFAMCSSLKEMKDDEDTKSMGSSQIQRSTSSSLTTNTTTATFASASSNQTGEGQDSDYKSLELDMDENAQSEPEFKAPSDLKPIDDVEDVSSFEATSSETDDSSKKSTTATSFKREDDEELRPLLETSITSLSSPAATTTPEISTEANDTSTLPETNQKSSSQASSNIGNGNKRKNKKKRR